MFFFVFFFYSRAAADSSVGSNSSVRVGKTKGLQSETQRTDDCTIKLLKILIFFLKLVNVTQI